MKPAVAVVIPSFKVRKQILSVIGKIGPEVKRIYVVDDACPEGTGDLVVDSVRDSRVRVICNPINLGVGGAVMRGYLAGIEDGMDILVKIDGDGQMDPALIPTFVAPIAAGNADYTKGNRFFNLEDVRKMPPVRIFGNLVLSFIAKCSTGYWNVFDPTNGYTAIHARVARQLPFRKISERYFFESDMLFRLNTLQAVVVDIPMSAHYADEKSNLSVRKVIGEFALKHLRNLGKRIFYNYYLRDMSIASVELPLGLALAGFGVGYGARAWFINAQANAATPAGMVMLAALPIILGTQLLLSALAVDIGNTPKKPIHPRIGPLQESSQ
jgi:dolichol-phosphate mannosyltransferase